MVDPLSGAELEINVLKLTDYVMPARAIVLGRMISVLEAEQIEDKKKQRNDRLLAIPFASPWLTKSSAATSSSSIRRKWKDMILVESRAFCLCHGQEHNCGVVLHVTRTVD
jgi:hypothetical protein